MVFARMRCAGVPEPQSDCVELKYAKGIDALRQVQRLNRTVWN